MTTNVLDTMDRSLACILGYLGVHGGIWGVLEGTLGVQGGYLGILVDTLKYFLVIVGTCGYFWVLEGSLV